MKIKFHEMQYMCIGEMHGRQKRNRNCDIFKYISAITDNAKVKKDMNNKIRLEKLLKRKMKKHIYNSIFQGITIYMEMKGGQLRRDER